MKPKQYRRWVDFSTRMARACYGGKGKQKSGALVLQHVREFLSLDWVVRYVPNIRSWDESDNDAAIACDLFSEFGEDIEPNFLHLLRDRVRRQALDLEERLVAERGLDWDSRWELRRAIDAEVESVFDSSAFDDLEFAVRECANNNSVARRVLTCVRAGLDMASEPSAGVLGFTVGDIRRMYPEGIPDWVALFKSKRGKMVDIRELPDHEGVWL